MMRYEFRGKLHTIKELSELSGIAPATLRDRIRRGYSVEQAVRPAIVNESVEHFCEASWWEDWIGMPISDLHTIYWKWCIKNGYPPISKQGFSRQILSMYPMFKVVPTKRGEQSFRIIRLR